MNNILTLTRPSKRPRLELDEVKEEVNWFTSLSPEMKNFCNELIEDSSFELNETHTDVSDRPCASEKFELKNITFGLSLSSEQRKGLVNTSLEIYCLEEEIGIFNEIVLRLFSN